MADLDTRNKRGSAIGIDFPSIHIYPNPDGTISAADRQQVGYKYQGIAAGAAGVFSSKLAFMGAG